MINLELSETEARYLHSLLAVSDRYVDGCQSVMDLALSGATRYRIDRSEASEADSIVYRRIEGILEEVRRNISMIL